MRCKIPNADLPARLDGTVCLYDKFPYAIRYDGEDLLTLSSLTSKKAVKQIRADDPLFDVSTPPLGYTQVAPERVLYVTRTPVRRYKQGIDNGGVKYTNLLNSPPNQYGFSFYTKNMQDTMSCQFPSIRQAIEFMKGFGGYCERAISNDCCLSINNLGIVTVFYKNEDVGFIVPNELSKDRPTVVVPHTRKGWIVSMYLRDFMDWVVQ